jgi:nucleotide-binding universal stress UspA family protein
MLHTILTPLDGSPFGEHALPLALAVAGRSGGTLRLLHVVAPPATVYSEGPLFIDDSSLEFYIRERQRIEGASYLEGVAKRIKGRRAAGVTRLVVEGDVRDAIRAQAESAAADLVVMTTHGRGPFGRFWLGSTADALVRLLPMPVLLIRPHGAAPDFEREPVVKHVLIAVDGSHLAEQIVEPAVELGALMGADFTLVRVVRPVVIGAYAFEGGAVGPLAVAVEELEAEHQLACERAEKYLEETAARLRARKLTVRTHVATEEQPAAGILREAEAAKADLIALATHGRWGLSRLFLGSVADKVVRGGTLPVLLRRPKEA